MKRIVLITIIAVSSAVCFDHAQALDSRRAADRK